MRAGRSHDGGWAAVAGLWQLPGHRRQFRRAHGGRTAHHFRGRGGVPAGAHRPPAAGGFRAGHVWGGLAARCVAQGLSVDGDGA